MSATRTRRAKPQPALLLRFTPEFLRRFECEKKRRQLVNRSELARQLMHERMEQLEQLQQLKQERRETRRARGEAQDAGAV